MTCNRQILLTALPVAVVCLAATASASPRDRERARVSHRADEHKVEPAHAIYPAPPNEATLRALDPSLPPVIHERRGTTVEIGGGVESGAETEDGRCLNVCSSSSVDIYAVAPVRGRLAIVSRIWGRALMDGANYVTYGTSTSGLRYVVAPGIWVEGAAGIARATAERDTNLDVAMGLVAPAVEGGAGANLGRIGPAELEVEVRGVGNLYDAGVPIYSADVLIGARW